MCCSGSVRARREPKSPPGTPAHPETASQHRHEIAIRDKASAAHGACATELTCACAVGLCLGFPVQTRAPDSQKSWAGSQPFSDSARTKSPGQKEEENNNKKTQLKEESRVGEYQAYFSTSHHWKYLFGFSRNWHEFQGINVHPRASTAALELPSLPAPSLPVLPHLEVQPCCLSAILLRSRSSK